MVSSLSSIGSFAATQLFNYRTEQLSSGQTSQSLSFDELVSNSKIQTEEKPSLGVNGITAMPSMKKSSETEDSSSTSSSSTNSDMDLNKDGQVTTDEIVRYLQMQMMENMSEEMCNMQSEENTAQQNNDKSNQIDFKNKIAATAYKAGETLLAGAAAAASASFLI